MTNISQFSARLSPETIRMIRNSKSLKRSLMGHFDISTSTLQLWLDRGNKNFTQYDCLMLINHHLGHSDVINLLVIN